MMGMKMNVFKLGNSMAASDYSIECVQNKTKQNQNQKYCRNHDFAQFLANSDMLFFKEYKLELGSFMAASDMSFEPIQNQTIPNRNQKT